MLAIGGDIHAAAICDHNSTLIKLYFVKSFPQIYLTISYQAGAVEVFLELINFYCVFLWSFMDLIIVAISICLSTRINQFNVNLEKYRGVVINYTEYNFKYVLIDAFLDNA